jgi:hypothetical protein
MRNGGEFFRQANTIFRRNTGCISRKIGAVWRKKDRRLGVLAFFKQALISLDCDYFHFTTFNFAGQ